MTADDYKKAIKRHLYAKNYGGVVEESVNHWNADIIGVNFKGETNEFEIKVALSDLRGEIKAIKRALQGSIYKSKQHQTGFWSYNRVEVDEKVSLTKLEKHYCYLVGDKQGGMSFNGPEGSRIDGSNPRPCFVPSKFYFAVSSDLVDIARELLQDIPYYGLMNADTGDIKKSARRLPRENIREVDMYNLFMRACTEWRHDLYSLEYNRQIVQSGHQIYVKRKSKSY